jgi:hypothetical protein
MPEHPKIKGKFSIFYPVFLTGFDCETEEATFYLNNMDTF